MPVDPRLNQSGGAPSPSSSPLPTTCAVEFAKVRERFETRGDGLAVLRECSDLVDGVIAQLYRELFPTERTAPMDFCLVALGGYGRRELFPFSDVDLLFLSLNGQVEASRKEAVAAMARALWDLRFRVGHTLRTLSECGKLHRDNLEFNTSLLDSRYLAGDPALFERLRAEVIPHLVRRDRQDLVRGFVEMTLARHQKHGNTIFHLEPNLKESPGGLRDLHVARWLTIVSELDKQGAWVAPEEVWPEALRTESARAFEFLAAARCFLHYDRGRDDNQLTYESQELAASHGVGCRPGRELAPADWMRVYFRHARSLQRLTARLLDEMAPARSSLYGLFQDWRSRLSNADFSVVRGRIFPRQLSTPDDLKLLLGLFEMMARHGLDLSPSADAWVEEAVARMPQQPPAPPWLWEQFRRLLVLPHAPEALRGMHRLGLLGALFPEFHLVDGLVVRDYFHRYTVDEHTLMAIENLHRLHRAELKSAAAGRREIRQVTGWEPKFGEILTELEKPELLFLCLLFHDVGKGMPGDNHVDGSLQAVEGVFERLGLTAEGRETVRFLISNHLEMSATVMRRDIFDPETIRAFALLIGSPERLKMLCLLTYADIKAVNPKALTPWKAEMLWQFYAATTNYLARSVDEERVHLATEEIAKADAVLRLLKLPAASQELARFLEGFPRRYLETHSPEEIAEHFRMGGHLADSRLEVSLRTRDRLYELTVLTGDRPLLFASLTGVLAAWGMNILKADAFANRSGIVLDTFRFVDLFRTLELNPSEADRLREDLIGVVTGGMSLQDLMRGRIDSQSAPPTKVKIAPQVRFDDASSSHSTLLELIARDRPGLLYLVSSTLAGLGCNIEVALIDTEGHKVIDVFYLTAGGRKLEESLQTKVREALLRQLQSSAPSGGDSRPFLGVS
ncbi:MAG: [protein-PII] uridylyltransferase [Acidobacteria bacterium]|nr:[protein-PII] uridylyltransferase [Acidobacteriota bacterium]